MFSTRLIRQGDMLLMLEAFAFLVRHYGLPERPIVPSPVKPKPGVDALRFDPERKTDVFVWARGALAQILRASDRMGDPVKLVVNRTGYPRQPDLLSFDPARVEEAGYFPARIVLQLAEGLLDGFETASPLNGFQTGVVRLATCAYLRQGFALGRCLPAVTADLADCGLPQRFVENTLVTGACLALTLRQQTPEQMIATYGTVMSPAMRRKIRTACRQLEPFAPELKLLRLLPRALPGQREPQEIRPHQAHLSVFKVQPQRISWT